METRFKAKICKEGINPCVDSKPTLKHTGKSPQPLESGKKFAIP